DAPERIANTASVSGGGDVNPSNTTSTDIVDVARGPNLTVTKTHTGNFTQGQNGAVYTITIKNEGGSPTNSRVFAIDQLPTGLNPSTISGTGWSCVAGPRTASCERFDALAPGASYPPITFSVNVAPDAPPTVTNTVRVAGGGNTNPEGAAA